MIGIIDYGVGNLRSVQKALESLGAQAVILPEPQLDHGVATALNNIDRLILPGVGAFADGMDFLRDRQWVNPIVQWVREGKPLLGICLGMQLLFEASEEDAPGPETLVPGLGLLPGKVVRFRETDGPVGSRLKVPHMGWNSLAWSRNDPLLEGLPQGCAVYFVHSFYPQPRESDDAPITSACAEYGKPFTATIWRDNLWATQFHPEKSQKVGLKILENFTKLA